MNKKIPVIVAVISLVIAAGGISTGIKANKAKLAAQAEADALRAQLAEGGSIARSASEAEPLVPIMDTADMSDDVEELRAQLAARDAELARLTAAMQPRRNNQQQGPGAFQDRMAQMQQEDPERYAAMIQRQTEAQEQIRYNQANQLAMFMNMDTSTMTPQELENHNMLVERLSSIWEMTGEYDMQNPPDPGTMREALGSLRDIGSLMEQERVVMFKQLGADVGLSGAETEEFAAYIDSVLESTSMSGMIGGMRGGGMRGGGMPGGGMRGGGGR